MQQANFAAHVGAANICAHVQDALTRAEECAEELKLAAK
jgi:hypothetical protein